MRTSHTSSATAEWAVFTICPAKRSPYQSPPSHPPPPPPLLLLPRPGTAIIVIRTSGRITAPVTMCPVFPVPKKPEPDIGQGQAAQLRRQVAPFRCRKSRNRTSAPPVEERAPWAEPAPGTRFHRNGGTVRTAAVGKAATVTAMAAVTGRMIIPDRAGPVWRSLA